MYVAKIAGEPCDRVVHARRSSRRLAIRSVPFLAELRQSWFVEMLENELFFKCAPHLAELRSSGLVTLRPLGKSQSGLKTTERNRGHAEERHGRPDPRNIRMLHFCEYRRA